MAQARGANGSFAVDPGRLGLVSGGGKPLPDAVRGQMEAALGADFSAVRVHVGPQAERIGAIAFTMGSDIYFAPGRFQPDTTQGQQLLGHELAHVVQQRAGRVRAPGGAGIAVVQDRALEAEADRLGQRAAAFRTPVQAKLAAMQPAVPVRISAPISVGPGRFRLTASAGGQQVGSVMVHTTGRTTAEVTDLGVDPAHRARGIGKMLLASAARTGMQFGKPHVSLAAQDSGSGRLTRWYQGMGFAPVGRNDRGFAQLEAPALRLLDAKVQRRARATISPPPRADLGAVRSSNTRIVQRANFNTMSDWPDSITFDGTTLTRVMRNESVIYENKLNNKRGAFHITIHDAPKDFAAWRASTNPIHGRLYISKREYVSAIVDSDGGGAAIKEVGTGAVDEDTKKALDYTNGAYLALLGKRPYRFSIEPSAHHYRTTAHKGTLFFNW